MIRLKINGEIERIPCLSLFYPTKMSDGSPPTKTKRKTLGICQDFHPKGQARPGQSQGQNYDSRNMPISTHLLT